MLTPYHDQIQTTFTKFIILLHILINPKNLVFKIPFVQIKKFSILKIETDLAHAGLNSDHVGLLTVEQTDPFKLLHLKDILVQHRGRKLTHRFELTK